MKMLTFLVVIFLMLFQITPVFAQTITAQVAPVASISLQITSQPPLPAFEVTPEILASIAGAVLSLLFSYIPGLNTKFAALDGAYKRLTMVILLLITSAALYGLGCSGIIQSGVTCDQNGLVRLVWLFILSVIANQGAYSVSPQTQSVKAAKELSTRLKQII